MRGSHKGCSSLGRAFDACGYIHTLAINWDGNQLAFGSLQGDFLKRVTRLFNPNGVSRVEQNASRQVECLLRSGHDQNVIGRTLDAPGSPQIVADYFSESLRTAWINAMDDVDVRVAAVTRHKV